MRSGTHKLRRFEQTIFDQTIECFGAKKLNCAGIRLRPNNAQDSVADKEDPAIRITKRQAN